MPLAPSRADTPLARPPLKVLLITTQTWLQVTRLALRLQQHGCQLSAICPQESALCSAGLHRHFRFRLFRPLLSLHRAIADSDAEYLVPADDLSVWFLHELADRVPSLRALIERSLGHPRHYPLLRSRLQLLALGSRLGIAVPDTAAVHGEAELRQWLATHGTSVVLKKDGTWGGLGVQLAHGTDEALSAYRRLSATTTARARLTQWLRNGDGSAFARLRCLATPQITAQTLIAGTPATSMYACHQGTLLGEVQARVAVSKGATGPSLVIELIDDPRIRRAATLLARELQLSGFFGLDFMLDQRTGEPLLIELNPRSTQLGPLRVAGQPELAGLLVAQWAGRPAPPPGDPLLASTVCYYPEGQQWARQAGYSARVDLLPAEQTLMASLLQRHATRRRGARSLLWGALSRLKGALRVETVPQPFLHAAPGTFQRPSEATPSAAQAPSPCLGLAD